MHIHQNIQLKGKHNKPILVDIYYQDNSLHPTLHTSNDQSSHIAPRTSHAKPIVIFAHGFKGFKDWGHYDLVAKTFAEAGFIFLKFNFSHNGTTPEAPSDFGDLEAFGNNNFIKELDDLDTVINYITTEQTLIPSTHINTEQIHLIGHSRGGGIVIIKAAEDPRITSVAGWASVASLSRYWDNAPLRERWKKEGVIHILNGRTKQNMPLYYQFCEVGIANAERLNVIQAASKLQKPFLIVHGTADPAVPYTAAQTLKDKNSQATLLTIEEGDHVFGGKHPWQEDSLPTDAQKVVQATIDFFS